MMGCLCVIFGGKTLNELRQSLILTDEKLFKGIYPRMSPTLKMVDIVDMFQEYVSRKLYLIQ